MPTKVATKVIVFDNLMQANAEVAGQTQRVKAAWPTAESFIQPNARGVLFQPNDLNAVSGRAHEAGAKFRLMFQ